MLYATLGLETKYLIISFIRVIPLVRSIIPLVRRADNAVFRNAAMICGIPPRKLNLNRCVKIIVTFLIASIQGCSQPGGCDFFTATFRPSAQVNGCVKLLAYFLSESPNTESEVSNEPKPTE